MLYYFLSGYIFRLRSQINSNISNKEEGKNQIKSTVLLLERTFAITLTNCNVLSLSERAEIVGEAHRLHLRVITSSGLQSPCTERKCVGE